MKKATKILLITAAVLIAVGAAVCMAVFAAAGFQADHLRLPKIEEKTYTVSEPFRNIRIADTSSRVCLLPSETGDCRVVYKGDASMQYTVTAEDGTLTVRSADARAWYEYIHIGFTFTEPELTVYLPQTDYEKLEIDTSSGSIRVPDGFTFSDADLSASSGSVTFEADVSNRLTAKASSGSVHILNASPENAEMQTSSGSVYAEGLRVSGKLTVRTTSGSLQLHAITCGELAAQSTSGSLRLEGAVASGKMQLDSTSGSVRLTDCDAESLDIASTSGSVSGTLLTEKIFITETTSGSVRVPQSQTGGICRVRTTSGSIRLSVG